MKLGLELLLAGFSAVLLVLLSTLETAYGQISDVTLHILRSGTRSARQVEFIGEIIERRDRFNAALLLGIHTTVIALAILFVSMARVLEIPHMLMTGFAATLVTVVVCRLLIPQLVSQNGPDRVLVALLPYFKPYYRVASVLLLPLLKIVAAFRRDRPEEDEEQNDDFEETMSDLQALIDVGAEEGIIEESEGLMIQSIVELSDTSVHEVMTPRTQMVSIPSTATVLQARNAMVEARHSRLPVYADQIDNIEGVLYVRDMLTAWSEGREHEPVTAIMRPAYFVPEVKPVADLLEEMRKSQVQIAMVIDEYGAVAGVVTIEDLLEEIVGEIEDEDVEAPDVDEFVRVDDGSVLVKGSTEIRRIELEFDTELEADDFTTVAGLVINELGHLPARGERLEFKGFEFEVLEADNRRVNLVRLRPLAQPSSDEPKEVTQQG
jgi:putative hemolysin